MLNFLISIPAWQTAEKKNVAKTFFTKCLVFYCTLPSNLLFCWSLDPLPESISSAFGCGSSHILPYTVHKNQSVDSAFSKHSPHATLDGFSSDAASGICITGRLRALGAWPDTSSPRNPLLITCIARVETSKRRKPVMVRQWIADDLVW